MLSRQTFRELATWTALTLAFSAGVAWSVQVSHSATMEEKVAAIDTSKVSHPEFRKFADSVLVELHAIHEQGAATSDRVQQMWCAGKPVGCR